MKKWKYATAIAFTSLIFFIGILIGAKITTDRTTQLQSQLQDDLLEMQSLDMEMSVVNIINDSSLCSYIDYRLPSIIKKKVELGREFDLQDIPEDQAGILEKQYILSLSKYWLFSQVNEKQCGIRTPSVVFFFDNTEQSREQGRVLDYLVYKSNESITVFAFNTGWNEPLVGLMMINYNVTRMPSIVVGDVTYPGLQTKEDVSSALCANYNLSFC